MHEAGHFTNERQAGGCSALRVCLSVCACVVHMDGGAICLPACLPPVGPRIKPAAAVHSGCCRHDGLVAKMFGGKKKKESGNKPWVQW